MCRLVDVSGYGVYVRVVRGRVKPEGLRELRLGLAKLEAMHELEVPM